MSRDEVKTDETFETDEMATINNRPIRRNGLSMSDEKLRVV